MSESRLQVTIRFYEDLNDFLLPEQRKIAFSHSVIKGQTIKDLIESLGLPHTEVELIMVNGDSVEFAYQLQDGDQISVYPVYDTFDIYKVSKLRPEPFSEIKFVLDGHLAKLARYLRMAGFDTLHDNDYSDSDIAKISVSEKRIVLTRDRGLLKQRIITHGRYVRNIDPHKQLKEIVAWLNLSRSMKPFTRCTHCNGLLQEVDKSDVEDQLEPDTGKYYQQFWRCDECGHIYWKGSHYQKMKLMISELEEQEIK
ncbi:MAG: twitching motility protein PilT [Gammaproteobacteria bacterium]|nr:twitching motility protein PilT [Gammaproteobacteria bacterium]